MKLQAILSVAVLLVVLGLYTVRTGNERGPWLWLSPVPTADLSIDLTGKTIVVTGANAGIGKQMTVAFAGMGARVIMACRSLERGEKAAKEVIEKASQLRSELNSKHSVNLVVGEVDVLPMDLASFDSMDAFSKEYERKYATIDVLVNNAAVMSPNTRKTQQGFGEVVGVNHLGVMYLTKKLLPLLADNSRIVNVASGAHRAALIDLSDIDFQSLAGTSPQTVMQIYGTSKLGNIIFTEKLAKALRKSNPAITVNSNHPGVIATELHRNDEGIMKFLTKIIHSTITISQWQGAQNTIYLATAPEVEGVSGKYFEWFGERDPVYNFKGIDLSSVQSKKENLLPLLIDRYWETSCRMVGVSF